MNKVNCLNNLFTVGFLIILTPITTLTLASFPLFGMLVGILGISVIIENCSPHDSVVPYKSILLFLLTITIPPVALTAVILPKMTIGWIASLLYPTSLAIVFVLVAYSRYKFNPNKWKSFGKNIIKDILQWLPIVIKPILQIGLYFIAGWHEANFKKKNHQLTASLILLSFYSAATYLAHKYLGNPLLHELLNNSFTPNVRKIVEITSITYLELTLGFSVLWTLFTIVKNFLTQEEWVLDTKITESSLNSSTIEILHLSDLHIPHQNRLTEDGEWNPNKLNEIFSAINIKNPKFVAITGDITDTGHEKSWKNLIDLCDIHKLKHNCSFLIAPGNHDLNVVGYGIPSLIFTGDDLDYRHRWKRIYNYFDAAIKIMGINAYCIVNEKLVSLSETWGAIPKMEEGITSKPIFEQRYKAACDLFPIIFVSDSENKSESPHFMIWNSVRPTQLAINNSYGNIELEQINRFEKLIKNNNYNIKNIIHLMHHKLILPSDGLSWKNEKYDSECKLTNSASRIWVAIRRRAQMAGMIMIDASNFLAMLDKQNKQSVILHGHHHSRFYGEIKSQRRGKIIASIVSAASSTLGAESYSGERPNETPIDVLKISLSRNGAQLVGIEPAF